MFDSSLHLGMKDLFTIATNKLAFEFRYRQTNRTSLIKQNLKNIFRHSPLIMAMFLYQMRQNILQLIKPNQDLVLESFVELEMNRTGLKLVLSLELD